MPDPNKFPDNYELSIRTSRTGLEDFPSLIRLMLLDLNNSWRIGLQLALRDLHGTYRQNILGFAWILLPPLVTTILWLCLNQAGIAVVASPSDLPYPLFLTSGTLLWSLFTDAVNAPRGQVSGNMTTLANLNFPPESVLISGCIQIGVNFLIRLALLIAAAFWFNFVPSIWLPAFLWWSAAVLLFGVMIGIFLIPFTSIYKDIGQSIGLVLPLLMYVTPVVYAIPEQGLLRQIMLANPLSYLFSVARSCLDGAFVTQDVTISLILLPLILFGTLFAWIIFRIALPHLVERG